MKLEMLAAKNGDCLILHCGTPTAPAIVLIDGGPAGVWDESLKPRLMEIRTERGLGDNQALTIDLVVISHVDDDHINGVTKLLQSIHDAKIAHELPLFHIDRLWHNSFDNILGNDETSKVMAQQFGAASTGSGFDDALHDHEAGSKRDAAFVLASIEQGDNVRRLAGALNIPLNPDFGGKLIQTAPPGAAAIIKIGDVEFTVVGPMHADMAKLQADHDTWLKNHPERQADAHALLASIDDKSVANLSSIVLLTRSKGKTILLTGDASGAKVAEGLVEMGATTKGKPFAVDLLKMPHHGSIRNIDAKFLKDVPAKSYAFSGNGKFGNPDRETFDLFKDARPDAPMRFVLSYRIADIDPVRKQEFEKERAKRKAKGKPEGPTWSDANNALKAILVPPPAGTTIIESSGLSVMIEF